MTIVEDHQVGDEVVVLDDLERVVPHIILDGIGAKVGPLGKFIETLAFVLRGLDNLPEFTVADVFQQESDPDDTPQFSERVVEFFLRLAVPSLRKIVEGEIRPAWIDCATWSMSGKCVPIRSQSTESLVKRSLICWYTSFAVGRNHFSSFQLRMRGMSFIPSK